MGRRHDVRLFVPHMVCPDETSPDTSIVTLGIGLNLHLELRVSEAITFSEKRADILRKYVA